MRMWVLPGLSVAMAVAVTFLYLTTPAVGGEAENPMLWASDDWVVWEQLHRAEAATRAGDAPLPESRFVRRFVSTSGDELWHMDQPWMALPEGWNQQMWRGGWLSGVGTALDLWREDPQDMARHWREGEDGAKLMRTAHGWALESEGWVVWSDRAAGVEAEGDALRPALFAPRGPAAPSSWWASRLGEAPVRASGLDQIARNAGIPWSAWATRWEGGGRWFVGAEWRQDLERLAREQGWSIDWRGNDVVVNGNDAWEWSTIEEGRLGQTVDGVWRGTLAAGGTVLWTGKSDMAGESVAEETGRTDMGSRHGDRAGLLGRVRNHRTQTTMEVRKDEGTMAAYQPDGEAVWRVDAEEEPLAGGAVEVDVYANGKYQAMFCLPSGLHLLDVKGREVSGFPLIAPQGDWTAWALVDYEGTRNYRYLVASSQSGLVDNFRREGASTPGWSHRPDPSIDRASPVRHIRHLRLGSKDYIYVGRANGQVELLKRNGATRATTPVRVDDQHPPLFRQGGNLDGTSVLYIDDTGWIREFTLGQGEEVGLSGAARADHLEQMDVDGDGRAEIVTWLRGERTVWNARNERME